MNRWIENGAKECFRGTASSKVALPVQRRTWLQSVGLAFLASNARGQSQDEPDAKQFQSFYTAEAQQAVVAGLTFIAERQNEDGSFGTGGYSRNVAVCSLCGMAMLASGSVPGRGPYGRQLADVQRFILDSSRDSGFIHVSDAASRGPMYGHGFATLFLAELYGTSQNERLRSRLSKAISLIVSSQNMQGGWRYEPRRADSDVSVTVCQVMALRAARNAGLYVPNETIDRAIAYVRSCQNEDGGFMYMAEVGGPSEFPRSAAALVALYGAGIYQGDDVDRALKYLMQQPPRSNPLGRQSYFLYGHYYAVQATWMAGGEHWKTWYPAIRDVLIEQQRTEDGAWFDVISLEYGTAMACLILQMPQNYLPIFRR